MAPSAEAPVSSGGAPEPPVSSGGARRLLTRLAPLLLVAGGAVAASLLVPSVPHEHRVTLRLAAPQTVTGIDLAWAPLQASTAPASPSLLDTEALQGGTWRFVAGAAPSTVVTHVSAPHGRYQLDVIVERDGRQDAFQRVISLGDSDDITVPLR